MRVEAIPVEGEIFVGEPEDIVDRRIERHHNRLRLVIKSEFQQCRRLQQLELEHPMVNPIDNHRQS